MLDDRVNERMSEKVGGLNVWEGICVSVSVKLTY